VSLRMRLQITLHLGALFIPLAAASAQQETITADQIVSKYMEAVGANRFSTITTFVETGELSGTATNLWQANRSA
jgi:hypothetical protein